MSTAYWAQWDHSEIISMHDLDVKTCFDNDDCDEEEIVTRNENECPKCSGCGCRYCLMLE